MKKIIALLLVLVLVFAFVHTRIRILDLFLNLFLHFLLFGGRHDGFEFLLPFSAFALSGSRCIIVFVVVLTRFFVRRK